MTIRAENLATGERIHFDEVHLATGIDSAAWAVLAAYLLKNDEALSHALRHGMRTEPRTIVMEHIDLFTLDEKSIACGDWRAMLNSETSKCKQK